MRDPQEPVPAHTRSSLAYQTLADLGRAGLRFCIWKSVDRFAAAAGGQTDHDILVDAAQRSLALESLARLGWTRLIAEPWRRFPDLHDFVRYDPACRRLIHLHVHFRLVMGEAPTKSLALPLEDVYLSTAADAGGLQVAQPELELAVYICRMAAKIGWWDAARAARRGSLQELIRPYLGEYSSVRDRCQRPRLVSLLERPQLAFLEAGSILKAYDDLPSWIPGGLWRLRRSLRLHRRYGLPARVALGACRRLVRALRKAGKTLPGEGRAFAFCGPEGSGKTALVDALEPMLGGHFRTLRLYMGGSPDSRGPLRRLYHAALWLPYLVTRRALRACGLEGAAAELARIYFGFEAFLIGLEKLGRSRRGRQCRRRGWILLYERYPLFPGAGDGGPNSDAAVLATPLRAIYRTFPKPDLIFLLRVDAEQASRRKPDHDPRRIAGEVQAFEAFARSRAGDPRVVLLDGSAPLADLADAALAHLCDELRADR